MSVADKIIAKCGGVARTAEIVGVRKNWIYRWRLPRERGGTGGEIPRTAQLKIMEAARQGLVAISPDDFFPNKAKSEGGTK
ncbi:hypothetical protein BV509_10285 [Rhodovulum sulfidophilum]|uniref:YdaS antitoxin of YdaST toxin-antitoxin system n=1 Tax=Rhodovulum visakhapatnamense TaxID=364297 RepID=A0ABS1RLU5_9RHOB|nr:hypothetical protein [Rhodovulum visakhapatnamense]MBL3571652.1 hypothetical protein [Rhodovulum visakhapatnamense]MBL3580637.1 hypothetical protein [Rhodovulum visakhapatnamense]OLS44688.1 hypothetical protein BV509_10285 [Rhodovulum sulfidophilum]